MDMPKDMLQSQITDQSMAQREEDTGTQRYAHKMGRVVRKPVRGFRQSEFQKGLLSYRD